MGWTSPGDRMPMWVMPDSFLTVRRQQRHLLRDMAGYMRYDLTRSILLVQRCFLIIRHRALLFVVPETIGCKMAGSGKG
jgi:hypothetical protein